VENCERFQFSHGLERRAQIRFVALRVGGGHCHI
jgi:hypothetical protein